MKTATNLLAALAVGLLLNVWAGLAMACAAASYAVISDDD